MTANQADYPIKMMSQTLGVSRSGFYAHSKRGPGRRSVEDEIIAKKIIQIHQSSDETYGAPRIHAELIDEGFQIGRKSVERLMKAQGLRGVSRRKFVVTTHKDP